MTRRRKAGSVLVVLNPRRLSPARGRLLPLAVRRLLPLALGGFLPLAAAGCSGSSPVDINYGTEAGADFDAPPRDRGTATDASPGDAAATPDAGTAAEDSGSNQQD